MGLECTTRDSAPESPLKSFHVVRIFKYLVMGERGILFSEPALPSSQKLLSSQQAHVYIMFCFNLLLLSVGSEQLTNQEKKNIESCMAKLSNYVDDSRQNRCITPNHSQKRHEYQK